MVKPEKYAPTVLRLALGLLMILPGINKLIDPSGITLLISSIGLPFPALLAWAVLLSEIIFGVAVLVGYKVKYTIWPLVMILAVATLTVVAPNVNFGSSTNLMFHILGIVSLISLSLTGPGEWAVDKH